MNDAPVLAFDIETVPDAAALRAKYDFSSAVSDEEVVEMAQRLHRQQRNSDFLPLPFHRVLVISCVLRRFGESPPVQVFSLAPPEYDEAAAISMFFRLLEKYTPVITSWNGSGFDLPVLNWRAMHHGISAGRYWQTSGEDSHHDKFRWNNYTSRYHERHTDLMDVLSLFQPRAWSGLEDAARLCGLPCKIGVGGGGVYDAWRSGDIAGIARYCEVDALLTYLLFVRFQHFRGVLSGVEEEERLIREYLNEQSKEEGKGEQWGEFLSQWQGN